MHLRYLSILLSYIFCTGVTFSQQTYSVREDEGILTVTVERYGDTEGHIVALIATHPTEGTANGNFKPCIGDHSVCRGGGRGEAGGRLPPNIPVGGGLAPPPPPPPIYRSYDDGMCVAAARWRF